MGSGQRAQTLPVNKAVECYFLCGSWSSLPRAAIGDSWEWNIEGGTQSSKKAQSETSDSWLTLSPSPPFQLFAGKNGLLQWNQAQKGHIDEWVKAKDQCAVFKVNSTKICQPVGLTTVLSQDMWTTAIAGTKLVCQKPSETPAVHLRQMDLNKCEANFDCKTLDSCPVAVKMAHRTIEWTVIQVINLSNTLICAH